MLEEKQKEIYVPLDPTMDREIQQRVEQLRRIDQNLTKRRKPYKIWIGKDKLRKIKLTPKTIQIQVPIGDKWEERLQRLHKEEESQPDNQ